MKNFDEFVNYVVSAWRTEKDQILENAGLSGLPNRISGDIAEKYLINRIKKLKPKYNAIISKGSQTPSDIYAVSRRNGFWHIMLIQVKSSKNKETIYHLNQKDISEFRELGKFVKKKVKEFSPFKSYKDKPIIISIGYVGVWNIKTKTVISHRKIDPEMFRIFRINCSGIQMDKAQNTVQIAHIL